MTGIRQQYTVKDLGIDLLCDIAHSFSISGSIISR